MSNLVLHLSIAVPISCFVTGSAYWLWSRSKLFDRREDPVVLTSSGVYRKPAAKS